MEGNKKKRVEREREERERGYAHHRQAINVSVEMSLRGVCSQKKKKDK
jgi:hypothetical protein